MIRITKSTDLTTSAGLGVGLEGVREDGRTLAWVAIPCTGGSVLQAANAHLPGASRRMTAHLKLFRALWKNAVIIMDAVLASGGIVAIEWPTSCAYWRFKQVKDYIKRNHLHKVKVHGCAFDMRNSTGGIVYKPWTIATSSKTLHGAFVPYRCSRDHDHAVLEGGETTKSSTYPIQFAKLVHKSFIHALQITNARVTALQQ